MGALKSRFGLEPWLVSAFGFSSPGSWCGASPAPHAHRPVFAGEEPDGGRRRRSLWRDQKASSVWWSPSTDGLRDRPRSRARAVAPPRGPKVPGQARALAKSGERSWVAPLKPGHRARRRCFRPRLRARLPNLCSVRRETPISASEHPCMVRQQVPRAWRSGGGQAVASRVPARATARKCSLGVG